jgi:hypothetical protein
MPSHASPRVGALPPRYALALNPHQHVRFTSCPRCGAPNRVRKIPLVIHVERAGLLVLRKSCRLCPSCEMIIVHQDELEPLIAASFPSGSAVGKRLDYLIIGTVEMRSWRQGLAAGSSIDEITAHMADFKHELELEVTPGGWRPTKPSA